MSLGLGLVIGAFTSVLRGLPRPAFPVLVRVVTFLYRRVARKDLRYLRVNIAAILGLAPGSPEAVALEEAVLRTQFASVLEVLRYIVRGGKGLVIEGAGEFDRLVAATVGGREAVFISAHCGGWELCPTLVGKALGKPLYVLAKPARLAALTAAMQDLREAMGCRVLWSGRPTLFAEMLATMQRGDSLGFVMDQKPGRRRSLTVDFLGRPTEFVSGPSAMVAASDCPLVAIFPLRVGPWHYRIEGRVLLPRGHGLTDETQIAQICAREIERVVRAHPEQWAWNYKRWRGMDGARAPAKDALVAVAAG